MIFGSSGTRDLVEQIGLRITNNPRVDRIRLLALKNLATPTSIEFDEGGPPAADSSADSMSAPSPYRALYITLS